MEENKRYTVLDHIAKKLNKAIEGSKLVPLSTGRIDIMVGEHGLGLEQVFDASGSLPTVFITDTKDEILTDDLLTLLNRIDEDSEGKPIYIQLKKTTIVVNGASLELISILDDIFLQLGDDYEFIKNLENSIEGLTMRINYEDQPLELIVKNEANNVWIEPVFESGFDPELKKIIQEEIFQVQTDLTRKYKIDDDLDIALPLELKEPKS